MYAALGADNRTFDATDLGGLQLLYGISPAQPQSDPALNPAADSSASLLLTALDILHDRTSLVGAST